MHRASALESLAPHLPEALRKDVLAEALSAAQAIQDERSRASALRSLAPHLQSWAKGELNTALWAAIETLGVLSKYPRPAFLGNLSILIPFWMALVPEEEQEIFAEEIFKAVRYVKKWWP